MRGDLWSEDNEVINSVATTVIGDIALVIAISTLLGALLRRVGQPAVIGQMLTGILLGPSLLGRLPGHLTEHLFPRAVLPALTTLAQVGVVVFMFTVGYEIEFRSLRGRGRTVPLIAASALLVPMSLGIACALVLRSRFAALGEGHTGRSFVLFMGVAVSITALPVLAALIRERDLAGTSAGIIATAAAGIMDVLAWLLLAAALIGTGHGGRFSLPVTVLLICGFVAVMLAVVRPALSWWTSRSQSILSSPVLMAFMLAMGGAWVTASLGLQPVFGGLLAGLVMRSRRMPPDADVLRSMDQAGRLLLPLFFIVTGLSLDVGSVHGTALALLGLFIIVSAGGKLVPAYVVSRLCGQEPRASASIAALVNTRGLTELIALNVGLTDGLIHQRLFTVLVLMALVNTLATAPLLSMIDRSKPAGDIPVANQQHGPGQGGVAIV
jgi:Kef-type K+ transport system membrane component KefB